MPNVVEFIQCNSRNYTKGRDGNKINKIVIHYTASDASAHNNLVYFGRDSAGASAHYFIDKDGSIHQSVKEGDRAWHAGNWNVNCHSIGIENVSAGEDFAEAQINSLASLVKDIMARYNIPASNVIRHYDVTGKECPAPYLDNNKWAKLHARITGGSANNTSTNKKSVDDVAREVINGKWGNGDERKNKLASAGYNPTEVQNRVNQLLKPKKSIDEVANEVIDGKWGNGDERKKKLTAAGYNPNEVQARVNKLLQ